MKTLLVLALWAASAANASSIVSVTLGSANLTGQVGQIVGWGFTLHVNTSDFVVVTGSSYVNTAGSVGYSSGIGTFAADGPDIIGFNGGPPPFFFTSSSADWVEAFLWAGAPSGSTGVRAFQICSSSDPACGGAPSVGATETGTITINFQYSSSLGDGGLGGTPIADSVDLPVSVTVEASPVTTTALPEPGTLVLLGGALVALAGSRAFRR